MRVLVTGANGFIGARIAAALRQAGHETVAAVRRAEPAGDGHATIVCDFARDSDPAVWTPRLAGIEAVVNCAGILRQTCKESFQSIHIDAPLALFRACAMTGVRRVVQISALGEPEDGGFIASKHLCDQALAALDLDWLVLRPGLVYSAHGAYGGTSLLRALAVLPGLLLLPGGGMQQLRPIAAEDLARGVVAALDKSHVRGEIIEMVGPQILSFRNYLLTWRAWFGLPKPAIVQTPLLMVAATVSAGEAVGRGPVCRVIWNLLEHGRVGSAQAPERMRAMLGVEPVSLAQALALRSCQAADFFAARWYWLRPLLLFALAFLWIASGMVGLLLPETAAQKALPNWPPAWVRGLALSAGIADVGLGIALLCGRRVRWILALMLMLVAVYTFVIGTLNPAHWLDPFGGLLKNIPVAVLLLALIALEPRNR